MADDEALRRKALRGLVDTWYLGSVILRLGTDEPEGPRPRREVEPIYQFVGADRPMWLEPQAKWMRGLCIPRYLAKTFIVLVRLLQLILRNPNIQLGYHCNEKDQAIEGVRLVREWLELPQIEKLYGSHKSRNWSAEKGIVSAKRTSGTLKNPTLRPLGLDKPLEGKRLDGLVWDDLLGLNNYSPEGVIKVERRVAQCRPLIKPGGFGLYVCTRWGLSDPYADGKTYSGSDGILRKWKTATEEERRQGRYWDCFGHRGFVGAYAVDGDEELFPYILEDDHPRDKQGRRLLFPSVYSESRIEEEKEGLHAAGLFYSQILNDPLPQEAQQFTESDVCQHFDLYDREQPGKLNPILDGASFFLAVDPTKGGDQLLTGDKVAVVVLGIKWVGKVAFGYVVDWIGGRWKTDRVIGTIFDLVGTWRPRKLFIETNVGGTWLTDPIKKRGRELGISHVPIEEVKQTVQSQANRIIHALQPAFAYRHIWIARHLHQGEGEEQLLRYTGQENEHNDFIDALATAWERGTAHRYGSQALADKLGPRVGRSWKKHRRRFRIAG